MKYEVTVSRTSTRAATFIVEAENEQEMYEKVLDQHAYNHDFSLENELDGVEYNIESFEPQEEVCDSCGGNITGTQCDDCGWVNSYKKGEHIDHVCDTMGDR